MAILFNVIKVRQQASNTDFIGYFFEPCLKKYIVSHHTPPRSGFVNKLAIPSSPPLQKSLTHTFWIKSCAWKSYTLLLGRKWVLSHVTLIT